MKAERKSIRAIIFIYIWSDHFHNIFIRYVIVEEQSLILIYQNDSYLIFLNQQISSTGNPVLRGTTQSTFPGIRVKTTLEGKSKKRYFGTATLVQVTTLALRGTIRVKPSDCRHKPFPLPSR